MLAPSAAEALRPSWLRSACETAAHRLAEDGVLYVAAAPLARARARLALGRHGLRAEHQLLHRSTRRRPRLFVSVSSETIAYAASSLVPLGPGRRLLALSAAKLSRVALLPALLPYVGTVFRRAEARPSLAWLIDACGGGPLDSLAVALPAHPSGSIVVLPFARGSRRPSVVAKVGFAERGAAYRAETAIIERLGESARRAGAGVPAPQVRPLDGGWLSLQAPARGRPATVLLRARLRSPEHVLGRLAAWLEAWHAETARETSAERLVETLLAAARSLAPELRNGEAYVAFLERRCKLVAGMRLPRVATHNDLTMANVFLGEEGLEVIDWEKAEVDGLPLVDLYYAAADAAAAKDGYANRPLAFARTFFSDLPYARFASAAAARIGDRLGIPIELRDLLFHACWLGHALNEREKRLAGAADELPFLAIAQRLADRAPPERRRAPRLAASPRVRADLSVIVSTVGRVDALERCVRGLAAGSLLPRELVVIDLTGTDLAPRLRTWLGSSRIELRRVPSPLVGLSQARNMGVAASRGVQVAFTDDDCVPDRGWLAAVASAFAEGADAVTGRVLPLPNPDPETEGVALRLDPARQVYAQAEGALAWDVGSGNNMCFRRDLLERIGGFDERFGVGARYRSAEDMEIFERALRAGATIVYEPEAIIYHEMKSRKESLRRAYPYGYGMGALAVGLGLRRFLAFTALYSRLQTRALARGVVKGTARRGLEPLVTLAGFLAGAGAALLDRRRA